MKATRSWLLLVALLSGVAVAQTHVGRPPTFKWDDVPGAERFELRIDAGAYVNVGLPPFAAGVYTLIGDPALTGSHSAVVRACSVALGCSFDSNIVAFFVDTPSPAPIPAAPTNLRLVATVAPPPPPPGPVESPGGTMVMTVGGGPIVDHLLASWTFGPKDPAVEGGLEFVIKREGATNGSASRLCYAAGVVYVFSTWGNGTWWKWTDDAALARKGSFAQTGTAPAGCV